MPPIPAMFTTGNGHRTRSSACKSSSVTWNPEVASHLPLVRGTPLGVPVVPEVQQTVARVSGAIAAGSRGGPGSVAGARIATCGPSASAAAAT